MPHIQGCGRHPKEFWAGQKMPRMEKGKEVRFEPHGSNWAPDSLTDSQGSEHSAWMGSVAVEQSFNVGVFRLLAVDRPTPRMCLIFRSILKPRVCSQGQQGWCLEPSWPGLSSHKSTLQGPRGFRDCWGGAVGFGETISSLESSAISDCSQGASFDSKGCPGDEHLPGKASF